MPLLYSLENEVSVRKKRKWSSITGINRSHLRTVKLFFSPLLIKFFRASISIFNLLFVLNSLYPLCSIRIGACSQTSLLLHVLFPLGNSFPSFFFFVVAVVVVVVEFLIIFWDVAQVSGKLFLTTYWVGCLFSVLQEYGVSASHGT